ncbi:MAG: tetratricopeptide repeat protein [Planctomycetota bacterium]|nr:tetratricopeptide repeat protein [Planctomycetota bacterium]
MSARRWQQIRDLFENICDLDPADRRLALSEACAGDADLRKEVESILACSEESPALFDATPPEVFPELFDGIPAAGLLGRRIGAYELVSLVATGGMGAVYLAKRADGEHGNEVAVKLIKREMLSESTLQHFRTERRTLAALDHPNIARMLDGGVTDDGLPYLMMEYISGEPIDRFCDARDLSTILRLRLFREVCAAVQFAHRNLVVHRDLKPSNILVTRAGTPKLLDFGIAKVLDPGRDDDSDASTVTAQRIMTPAYASPEQIRGETITTASDVYSLGVVLYELLTGCRPFRISGRTPHEIERTVCEDDPAKPSTAIRRAAERRSDNGSSRITLSVERSDRTRFGQAARLSRRLAGDLDAIVLRALRKEPHHRYASVHDLSEDIRRHLEGLPVTARSGGLRYRMTKFVRRNAPAVVAGMVLWVALAAFLVGLVWQRDKAVAARQDAEVQSIKAERINDFLQDMLASVDPYETAGHEATVRNVLDKATAKLENGFFKDQPEIEAAARMTIGATYCELGLHALAEQHLTTALEIRTRELGENHLDVAESLDALGLLSRATGDYDEAERLYIEALALRRALLESDDLLVAETMNNLGVVLRRKGKWQEAEAIYREALAIRRSQLGDQHEDVATSFTNLAALLKNRGELDEAEPLYRDAIDIFRASLGQRHVRVAIGLNNLALLLMEKRAYGEAESLLREALAIRRIELGDEHPGVSRGLHNLALVLAAQGKNVEAEALYREALALRRKLLDAKHPHVAYTANSLARLLGERGDWEAAEPLARESLMIRREKLPADHPSTAASLVVLGRILLGRNDPSRAEPLLREAVEILQARLSPGDRRMTEAKLELAGCMIELGQFEQAERMLLGVHSNLQDTDENERMAARPVLKQLIRLYEAWNRPDSAKQYRQLLPRASSDEHAD